MSIYIILYVMSIYIYYLCLLILIDVQFWRVSKYSIYNAKFSRRIMFAFFTVGIEPRKLSSAKFKNTLLMLMESLIRELFP